MTDEIFQVHKCLQWYCMTEKSSREAEGTVTKRMAEMKTRKSKRVGSIPFFPLKSLFFRQETFSPFFLLLNLSV